MRLALPRLGFPVLIITSAIAVGLLAGVGGYTFIYAKGGSYLTNDPAACANCHSMTNEYRGWTVSSHRAVATCNDCHMPDAPLQKVVAKLSNGFWHSFAFTTGRYPEHIRIKPHNRDIAEKNCRRCHSEIVAHIDRAHSGTDELKCTGCHADVGHR